MSEDFLNLADLTFEEACIAYEQKHAEKTRHDQLYHQQDQPEISDADYDQLVQYLKKLETQFPSLRQKTQQIGAEPAAAFTKIQHAQPMLSLTNAFTEKEVSEFFAGVRRFLRLPDETVLNCVAEPKIDGLSLSLRYVDRQLIRGVTRGNGKIGEDVTHNLRQMTQDIPEFLPAEAPALLEVRGEIYMARSAFLALNESQKAAKLRLFANPRNAAAGSLRRLDLNVTEQRHLQFFAYAIGETNTKQPATQWELLQWLKKLGFPINELSCRCTSVAAALAQYEILVSSRYDLPYAIDGVVYKIERRDWQKRLGATTQAPRWAIAHKLPAEQAQTRVEEIRIQVGRTGALTPVAILCPVTVGGVVVSRASLHNEDEIARKDIRIGDMVRIQRAGDVIPQILSVVESSRLATSTRFIFPQTCPECGSLAKRNEGDVVRQCTGGMICPAQIVERLRHFVSRDAADIAGLGGQQIKAFFAAGWVCNPADLFTLEQRDQTSLTPLRNWKGWGVQSSQKLFAAIDARRTLSTERFIFALGIPQIGQTNARLLALHYGSFAALQHCIEQAIEETIAVGLSLKEAPENGAAATLMNIEGIGPSVTADLIFFFAAPHNQTVIKNLLQQISITNPELPVRAISKITGLTIVFTGTLTHSSRNEAKARAEALGAKVASTVSNKTDYVVAGADAGSKLNKARTLGVTIIQEEEWQKLSSVE